MKTFSPTPADIDRQWYLVDAEDQILGPSRRSDSLIVCAASTSLNSLLTWTTAISSL